MSFTVLNSNPSPVFLQVIVCPSLSIRRIGVKKKGAFEMSAPLQEELVVALH